jgi:hypothetical protein
MFSKDYKKYIFLARVVIASFLLNFFTIPHVLKDFLVGEPQRAGVSPMLLAYGVAGLFALEYLALFYIGQGK